MSKLFEEKWSGLPREDDRMITHLFNNLPFRHRKIVAVLECRTRIQELLFDKQRRLDEIRKIDKLLHDRRNMLRREYTMLLTEIGEESSND